MEAGVGVERQLAAPRDPIGTHIGDIADTSAVAIGPTKRAEVPDEAHMVLVAHITAVLDQQQVVMSKKPPKGLDRFVRAVDVEVEGDELHADARSQLANLHGRAPLRCSG